MIAEMVRVAGGLVPEGTSAHTLQHIVARSFPGYYPGDVVGFTTLLGRSSLDTTRLYSQPEVSQSAIRAEPLNINVYAR
jgi:integrase/recombinase XerC